jgi:activator of 2-hydroxyglutaryl-CoA dehydratase
MNDKCAAGSGRFLEMVCRRLDLDHLLLWKNFWPFKSRRP